MYALFIVLNEVDYLDTVLAKFVEIGVSGATILDSQGMAGAIVDRNLPLFGSLKTLLDGSRPFNKTIFTVIDTEELLNKTISVVEEVTKDITKPGVGMMFTVPVGKVHYLGKKGQS